MEDKCNMNIKKYAVYLIGKKLRMTGDMIMYRYKNILRGQ